MKNIDIKQLSKASAILEKIQTLDAEIIKIDKIALIVSSGQYESDFSLKVKDESAKKRKSINF